MLLRVGRALEMSDCIARPLSSSEPRNGAGHCDGVDSAALQHMEGADDHVDGETFDDKDFYSSLL